MKRPKIDEKEAGVCPFEKKISYERQHPGGAPDEDVSDVDWWLLPAFGTLSGPLMDAFKGSINALNCEARIVTNQCDQMFEQKVAKLPKTGHSSFQLKVTF